MGSAFTQQDAQFFSKNWYTHAIYTWGPQQLATGVTQIFAAQNWTAEGAPEWIAELVALWVTSNAQVQISWSADNASYNQGNTLGFTDASRPGVRRLEVRARAASTLSLQANNSSGAAIPGYQLSYEIVFRKLTVAEKILYGYATTAADEQLASRLQGGMGWLRGQVKTGIAPVPWTAQRDRTLLRLGDHPASGLYHVTASPTSAGTNFLQATVTATPGMDAALAGEFIVLEQLVVPAASAITLLGTRDTDDNLLTLNGAAFAQADYAPWRVTYFAQKSFQFAAGAAALLNNVPVYVGLGRYRLTDLWRARLAAGTPAAAAAQAVVPADTWAQALSGAA